MAQLLLVTVKTLSPKGNRRVSDIVGVFPDDHVFSKAELTMFKVVKIPEKEKDVINKRPFIAQVTRAKTTDWTVEEPETKEAWKDSEGNYKEIVDRPEMSLRYENGQVVDNISTKLKNHDNILIPARRDG